MGFGFHDLLGVDEGIAGLSGRLRSLGQLGGHRFEHNVGLLGPALVLVYTLCSLLRGVA